MILKLETAFRKLAYAIDAWTTDYAKFVRKNVDKTIDLIDSVSNAINKNIKFKRIARMLSFPWHWIIIWIWMWDRKRTKEKLIFDKPGLQIITGEPGSGKSSLAYELAERSRTIDGKGWYINTALEKPRFDPEQEQRYLYHQLFKFTDFWRDRKQIIVPNHMLFGGIILDEWHRILNYRENGTTDYNDKFIPFQNYAVVVRHYIKKIILLTQMSKVDTQVMALCASLSEVRIDIGFDYPDWLLESGLFRVKPLGWRLDSYKIDTFGDSIKRKRIKKMYIKQKFADFDYFDTYSMSGAYDHLDMHYPANIKKGRIYT